jgi:hypothetical protein
VPGSGIEELIESCFRLIHVQGFVLNLAGFMAEPPLMRYFADILMKQTLNGCQNEPVSDS